MVYEIPFGTVRGFRCKVFPAHLSATVLETLINKHEKLRGE